MRQGLTAGAGRTARQGGDAAVNSPTRILAGLVLGVLFGLAMRLWFPDHIAQITAITDVMGGLWLNALRMTVLPLIFALLVNGVLRSAAHASGGSLSRRTVSIFGVLYVISLISGIVIATSLLHFLPIPEGARLALTGGVIANPPTAATPGEMILAIVPTNVFEAAASGALLPIVTFSIFLGAALSRLNETDRAPLVALTQSLTAALFVIIHWVLILAPLGVFGLIASSTMATGTEAITGLLHYIVVISAVYIALTLFSYPVARFAGGVGFARFARAIFPAQAVAASTRSSLATLPAMLEASDKMDIDKDVSAVALPLAVSIFRFGGTASSMAVGLYGASIYGITPALWLLVPAALVAIISEFGSVGLPNQANFMTAYAPTLAVLGVPVEFLAILIAVDTIPDIFMTVCNVSMDVAATAAIADSPALGAAAQS
jgi:proton glutamate symport protein